jgi:hypothetical protein
MKRLFYLFTAITAMLATSCIEHHVTIELNKDGSGTLTEETTLSAQALQMMEQMAAGIGGGQDAGANNPLDDLQSAEKAAEKAKGMGEGVTVQKVEKVEDGGRKGARVTFAFEDINKVDFAYNETIGDLKPEGPPQGGDDAEPEGAQFEYADGVLTIRNPVDKQDADAPADAPVPGDAELAQAKQMMGDMKMSMKIVLPGGIAETNATHVEGNTVTFLEMDMGKVIENPDAFRKLNRAEAETPAEMQAALKGVEGVKAEAEEVVTIKLK